jgi:CheY-like chemotaxis protein
MAHVLVVDDDDSNRDALNWVLTDSGYEVELAATAEDGLRILRETEHAFVVVFDYVMPDLTGDDLVRMAEEQLPFLKRHAFICLTASPTRLPAHLTAWLVESGAPIVGKPFELDALLEVVARAAARLPAHT